MALSDIAGIWRHTAHGFGGPGGVCRLGRFRFNRLAVPFGIAEMMMCLHEIINREIILAVVKPRAAPDDLLELDDRIDRAHQHDVADVPRVDAG